MVEIIEFFIKLINRFNTKIESITFNLNGNIKVKIGNIEVKYKIYLEDDNICIQIPKYSNDKFNCWLIYYFVPMINQKIYLIDSKYISFHYNIVDNEIIKLFIKQFHFSNKLLQIVS